MTRNNDASHAALSDAEELGHEARAGHEDHAMLKLWLRMLASTTQIEAEIRRRLRERFGISLARFDYMAQLYRYEDGLKMRVLSRYLMVTGGNVTGLTDELEREGMVARAPSPDDRRAWIVSLTPTGRRTFETMASEHEQWILEMFSGLDMKTVKQMHTQLGLLRVHVMRGEPSARRAEDERRHARRSGGREQRVPQAAADPVFGLRPGGHRFLSAVLRDAQRADRGLGQ